MTPESVGVQGNNLVLGNIPDATLWASAWPNWAAGFQAQNFDSVYMRFMKLAESKKENL